MRKSKTYSGVRFSADVIKKGVQAFREIADPNVLERSEPYMKVVVDEATWSHDSEHEFFADYRQAGMDATYTIGRNDYKISIWILSGETEIEVAAPSRHEIESVFHVFERYEPESRLPDPPEPETPPPTIFIGHGRSQQWRDLKDHLQDKHGYDVDAYEIGARAGHTIRDILKEMLLKSTFAVLVLTGEDETSDGGVRARQNVVHETGLFQGKLGFSKAIVLLEEGTEQFSNLQGIEQIRYSKGNIKETYGEVLATLRREFGKSPK